MFNVQRSTTTITGSPFVSCDVVRVSLSVSPGYISPEMVTDLSAWAAGLTAIGQRPQDV